jgi:cation diffusion facilitator family transporter
VVYYIVASIFMRLARKPADEEHPYGHRQLESIAALIVGSFVITTAVAVFWDSVGKVYSLWTGETVYHGALAITLWVALLTILVKIGLTIYTRRIGQVTGNAVVMALAYDHRNDIFSSSAAAVGIFLGQRGLSWIDPLAGALVAIVILRTGLEILRESSVELMDAVPSRRLHNQVVALVKDLPDVYEVEEVQAHRFGPYLVMNITICISGDILVHEGDAIATNVEEILYDNIPYLRRVHVHYHPGDPCQPASRQLSVFEHRHR